MAPLSIDTTGRKRSRSDDHDEDHYSATGRTWVRTDEQTFEARDASSTRNAHSALPADADYYGRYPIPPAHPSLRNVPARGRSISPVTPPPPPPPTATARHAPPIRTPEPVPRNERWRPARQQSAPPPQRRVPAPVPAAGPGPSRAPRVDDDGPPLPPEQVPRPPNWLVKRLMQRRDGDPRFRYRPPYVPQAQVPAVPVHRVQSGGDENDREHMPRGRAPQRPRPPREDRDESDMETDEVVYELVVPHRREEPMQEAPQWETLPHENRAPAPQHRQTRDWGSHRCTTPRDTSPMSVSSSVYEDELASDVEEAPGGSVRKRAENRPPESWHESLVTFRINDYKPEPDAAQAAKPQVQVNKLKNGSQAYRYGRRKTVPAPPPLQKKSADDQKVTIVGIEDIQMECPVPGCTEIIFKTNATLHVRRVHPQLTRRRETVVCPMCAQTLKGENYAKHFVSHFPRFRCPYGCGAHLARLTVSERRRHFLCCKAGKALAPTWEEADEIALSQYTTPVIDWSERFDPEKKKQKRTALHQPEPESPAVMEETEPESDDEEDIPLAHLVRQKVAAPNIAPAEAPPSPSPAPEDNVEMEDA